MTDMSEKLWRDPATQDIWSDIDPDICDEDDKLVEYRRADLPPSREQVEAMVKPLVWDDFEMYAESRPLGMVFSISFLQGSWWFKSKCFSTLEEAKAAAQADYTRRILAALGYEANT